MISKKFIWIICLLMSTLLFSCTTPNSGGAATSDKSGMLQEYMQKVNENSIQMQNIQGQINSLNAETDKAKINGLKNQFNSLKNTIRSQTLATLGDLESDVSKKQLLFQFLNDAKLLAGPLRINLATADFSGVDLSTMKLRAAVLDKVNLTGSNLSGVDLINASLRETNLSNANITDTTLLTGAKYTTTTTWPAKFDPLGAGAQLVEK